MILELLPPEIVTQLLVEIPEVAKAAETVFFYIGNINLQIEVNLFKASADYQLCTCYI